MEILSVLTWLEIIDSAVKIGLGALIGAFATYFAVRETQKGESRARRDQRKSDLIQEVAVGAESIMDGLVNYFGVWSTGVEAADGKLSAECIDRLSEIGNDMVSKKKEFSSAGALLMLLGLTDSIALFNAYGGHISALLGLSMKTGLPSIEEVEEAWFNVKSGREAFLASLSKDFISDE